MDEEMAAIKKDDTWELIKLSKNQKVIGVKWVYKTKQKQGSLVDCHKVRLVVRGYKQKLGIDYYEVFAPVAKLEMVRLIIAMAAQNQWKILQIDIKPTFLNGYLEKEVSVEQSQDQK